MGPVAVLMLPLLATSAAGGPMVEPRLEPYHRTGVDLHLRFRRRHRRPPRHRPKANPPASADVSASVATTRVVPHTFVPTTTPPRTDPRLPPRQPPRGLKPEGPPFVHSTSPKAAPTTPSTAAARVVPMADHELTYLGESLQNTPCIRTAIAPAEEKTSSPNSAEHLTQVQ